MKADKPWRERQSSSTNSTASSAPPPWKLPRPWHFASHALKLLENGYSPMPVAAGEKQCMKSGWDAYRSTPMTVEAINQEAQNQGVSVASGYNRLVIVDIDTDDQEITAAILSVLPAYVVAKAGRRGMTLFYRAPAGFDMERGKNYLAPDGSTIVQFLINGQTAIPPTIHPGTGNPYAWLTPETLLTIKVEVHPELPLDVYPSLDEALKKWLPVPRPAAPPSHVDPSKVSDYRLRAYAIGALQSEANSLAMATKGGRNPALFNVACTVGNWVHHKVLGEREVYDACHAACTVNGLIKDDGPHQFRESLKSGLKRAAGDDVRLPPETFKYAGPEPDVSAIARGLLEGHARAQASAAVSSSNPIETAENVIALPGVTPSLPGRKEEDPFGPDVRAMAAKLKFPRYQCKDPKSIPPRDWLYGKHLIRKFVSARFAAGATGKTQLCLAEALAMVTGKPLLGMEVKRPFNVLVWNGEDPQEEIERRFEATRFYYRITPEDIKGRLFLVSGRDYEMKLARTVERSTLQILEPIVDAMTAFIRAEEVDVAMFDPFISSHSVPENDNTMIDAVVKEWGKIAEFGNCSIELVHHMRKGNGHERTVEDGRGASALKDAARDAQLLVKASPDEAAAIGAEEGQEWRYFRIGDSKSNMAPPVNKATWFKLESVNLDNGNEENKADEVGVVTRVKPKSLFEDVSRDLLDDVFRELRVGQGQRYDKRSPAWFGRLVASKLDLDHEKDRDRRRIEGMIEQWRKSGAILVEARRDTKQGRDLEWVVCGNWFDE